MKFPIAWHEECLKNSKESLERDRQAMEAAKRTFERSSQRVFHYERQIHEAKARGLNGFDSERFLKGSPSAASKLSEGDKS